MIRRTRRRPRVDSTSYRTLGWLIRIEAVFQTLRAHHGDTVTYFSRARVFDSFAKLDTAQALAFYRSLTRRNPL